MPRLPRNTDPNFLRHVSIRVENAQLLLRPDNQLNEIIGGIIAKYQHEFGIKIYAYTFLSNHYHLLALAPRENLWRFEQGVNREIARRVNNLRGRRGHFWSRRYDEQIIPEETDILEALLYIVCNAVSHGLVRHPKYWPGIHSYFHLLDEKDRGYSFIDYTAYRKARLRGEKVKISDFKRDYSLCISVLPEFEKHSKEERRKKLSVLIEERVQRINKERKNRAFLGQEKALSQSPFLFPKDVKNSSKPICYSKTRESMLRFFDWFFNWLAAYRKASKLFRSGKFLTQFPPFSIRPPLLYCLN